MLPSVPQIAVCQVTSHEPPWGVRVIFRSTGQGIPFRVRMGYDYADALRVHQKPLPGIGTWGLVAVPNGDLRCAVWLCAYYPSQVDALTSDGTAGAPFIENKQHWSGHWDYLDASGNVATQFADQSYLVVGASQSLPTIYRHTVNAQNVQVSGQFTQAQRIPSPPSAFNIYLNHKSGTSILVDVSGNTTVSGATGAQHKIAFGGSTATIDASGNVTVSGASNAQLQFLFGGATLTIASNGLVSLNLPGTETLNLSQGGASVTDALVLVSKLVTQFNSHTHKGVSTGSGNSSTPTTNITAAEISSAIAKTSG